MKRLFFILGLAVSIGLSAQITELTHNTYGSQVKDRENTNFNNLQDSLDAVAAGGAVDAIARAQLQDSLGGLPFSNAVNATGTPGATTYYRGDNSWVTPSTGGVNYTYNYDSAYFVDVWGLPQDGSTDATAAINNIIQNIGGDWGIYNVIRFPQNEYVISSSILIDDSFTRLDFQGSRINAEAISDGSAAIETRKQASYLEIRNVLIFGESGVRDSDGIKLGGYSVDSASYENLIENVEFHYCDTAFYQYGWETTAREFRMRRNNVGVVNEQPNGNLFEAIDIILSDIKDFAFYNGNGLHLDSWVVQNPGLTSQLPSTFDNVSNVVINNMYLEAVGGSDRDSSWIVVGPNNDVNSFKASGIRYGGNNVYGIPCIDLRNVNGANVQGYFGGAFLTPVNITSNARNVKLDVHLRDDAKVTDNGDNLGREYNYFPNSSFEHWFGGWSSVDLTGVTISQDTVYTKSGKSALRITGVDGTSRAFCDISIEDNMDKIRGKDITVGAWMYLPDNEYFEDVVSGRALIPHIRLRSYAGAAYIDGEIENYPPNGWSYIQGTISVQDSATKLLIRLTMNYGSIAILDEMWLVFDDVQMYESGVPLMRVIQTSLPDAPTIEAEVHGGYLHQYDTATPTDADQYYNVGDYIENPVKAVGSPKGWYCTVAGAGGTATWVSEGNL